MSERLSFGVMGLGRMGAALAAAALDKGIRVVGYDPHASPEELVAAGLHVVDSLAHLGRELEQPRIVLLYVPAGAVVDQLLDELLGVLEPGDVVADGGNSYWRDSQRRAERLAKHEIGFVDLGTSGGISGARHGACFMAGGEAAHVATIEPLLRALAVEGGFVHAGPSGAGHLAKLVHNGIEFGMLQAIGEGVALLEAYNSDEASAVTLDVESVLRAWRHGSVIRSWLIDLMHQGYRERGGLDTIADHVEDTGEVSWLVADAFALEQPVPVIAQSVVQLFASRLVRNDAARAIAVMRHGFGGHPFGHSEALRNERHASRIGATLQ